MFCGHRAGPGPEHVKAACMGRASGQKAAQAAEADPSLFRRPRHGIQRSRTPHSASMCAGCRTPATWTGHGSALHAEQASLPWLSKLCVRPPGRFNIAPQLAPAVSTFPIGYYCSPQPGLWGDQQPMATDTSAEGGPAQYFPGGWDRLCASWPQCWSRSSWAAFYMGSSCSRLAGGRGRWGRPGSCAGARGPPLAVPVTSCPLYRPPSSQPEQPVHSCRPVVRCRPAASLPGA